MAEEDPPMVLLLELVVLEVVEEEEDALAEALHLPLLRLRCALAAKTPFRQEQRAHDRPEVSPKNLASPHSRSHAEGV